MIHFNKCNADDLFQHLCVDTQRLINCLLMDKNYIELLSVINQLRDFLAGSRDYPDICCDFLNKFRGSNEVVNFRKVVLQAVSELECVSGSILITNLNALTCDQSKLKLLYQFATVKPFLDKFLEHERNTQLSQEAVVASLDSKSKVLLFGCGPMPLSAIIYACHGAEIVMVDRDPKAYDSFRDLYEVLPACIRENIQFRLSSGADISVDEYKPTHVLLASMMDSKEYVLNNLVSYCERTSNSLIVMFRDSRGSLLEMYTCPMDRTNFNIPANALGYVNVGAISPSITFIFKIIGGCAGPQARNLLEIFSEIEVNYGAEDLSISHASPMTMAPIF